MKDKDTKLLTEAYKQINEYNARAEFEKYVKMALNTDGHPEQFAAGFYGIDPDDVGFDDEGNLDLGLPAQPGENDQGVLPPPRGVDLKDFALGLLDMDPESSAEQGLSEDSNVYDILWKKVLEFSTFGEVLGSTARALNDAQEYEFGVQLFKAVLIKQGGSFGFDS